MTPRVHPAAALVVVALCAAGCGADTAQPAWAVLTELGRDNVPMRPGANVRLFNEVDLNARGLVDYDTATGYLTLQPGTYRVDGWSLTTFGYELTKDEQAQTFSAPGYAFLWNVDTERIELLGSMQDPLYGQPSILDGIVEVPASTRYYLAHQNGRNVAGIHLQVYDPDATMPDGSVSTNHAFARLVVEPL